MAKKRPPITAAELSAELQANPEFVAAQRKRDAKLARRVRLLRIEEEPILTELRGIGWKVESVWTLVNTSTSYAEAIPILLKHLRLPYSDTTRDGIARSLAVPDARFAWAILADEYRKEPDLPLGEGQGRAKQGLAAALSATATKDVIDELIAIAKDRSHGESRILLLRALRQSKQPQAKQALAELASDPDLAKEIASWRGSR